MNSRKLNGMDVLPFQKDIIVSMISFLGAFLFLPCTYCKLFMPFLWLKSFFVMERDYIS